MKVLIVDDTPINLLLLKSLVAKIEGCEPLTYEDPAKALAWCAEHEPDLVLLDYMMPNISGLEFLPRFRALPGCSEVPVLMVTADHEAEVRYRALDAGANDFLTKPVDRIEFLARAKNMLALRTSHKQLANRAEWLADEVRKATAEIVRRERETIFCLSRAAEYRDPETGAHIVRMAHYSRIIGRNLNLPEAELDMLFDAAPMHDIGKVGTPDNILLKPGRLDDAEFEIMKRHATIGYEILHASDSPLMQVAAVIAGSHHEKFDGSGYPAKLSGENIPLFGRIVAVADVFDALTSERPYKRAWKVDEAVAFLREWNGRHFDPRCIDAFFKGWDDVLAIKEQFRDEE
ncbi:Cyclic di-GMP phosphodiesterase response regulator RpfG [Ferriphaselus amnicola]|uniref:Cyclic di-GMP phosphodiesterase response regulator RpfG n=1 Tax=Ferriphaselus amnicola TaxID=1188319 RepID=A0A2Z6GA22_9PROT|nr:HD domain-containing phosphohydrolase [Ferriphaselus amnicola]BBE50308.1 Cyclic di-GMP phosphodiesterase response regulator RpfG [Ferriphaselus amnicola]